MSEVKKSFFLALDSGTSTAATIAAAGTYNSEPAAATNPDDRDAYILEPSGLPDLTLDYEEVTRDVIRNSYLGATPLRGIINSTGSMTVELHNGGINSAASDGGMKRPDYHPLLKSAFGGHLYLADDVTAGSCSQLTQTLIDAGTTKVGTACTGLTALTTAGPAETTAAAAGDVVVIKDDGPAGGDNYFIIQLTSTTAGKLLGWYPKTLYADGTPNLVYSPFSSYWMPTTVSAIPNFAIAYYRANIVRELYAKCTVTSLEIPMTAGEISLPVFNFNVGDGSVASQEYWNTSTGALTDTNIFTAGTADGTSNVAAPLFAKSVDWTFEYKDVVDGTPDWTAFSDKITDSVTITLNNEASVKKDITQPEGINSYGVQSRAVEYTITAYYDDDTGDFTENLTNLFTAADNRYRLRATAVIGDTAENRCFLMSPRLAFKPTVEEDAGLFKWNISATAEKDPDTALGTGFGDNALVCVFF